MLSYSRILKRGFDIVISATGLFVLSPILLLIAVLVKLTSIGPAIFKQPRIGRNFELFHIYKFRTMVHDAPSKGPALTVGGDPRITRIGKFLRWSKLDEFPQLFNVLKGEMSLVGPRPEVSRYVEMFRRDYEEILTVRPGITDLASLQFRHESDMLTNAIDPEREYCDKILPAKIQLSKEYIRRSSFALDLNLILRTFAVMLQKKSQVIVSDRRNPSANLKSRQCL